MKGNRFFVILLAILMVFAFATNWTPFFKFAVITDALFILVRCIIIIIRRCFK